MINFQMFNGKLNIPGFVGMIADAEAENLAVLRGWKKRSDPMPNQLEIRIVRARNLVKSYASAKDKRRGKNKAGSSTTSVDLSDAPSLLNDKGVKVKAKDSFDPYVVVTARQDKRKTATQNKTDRPMFNETFFFNVTDSSTVLQVEVYNREIGKKDQLLGWWVMTMKYMLCDPYYCWHEKGMFV